jgi:hypothetical protein
MDGDDGCRAGKNVLESYVGIRRNNDVESLAADLTAQS